MRRKKKSRRWFYWAHFVCLVFAAWQIWRSDEVQMRFVYLWPYQEEIIEYSKKNKLDPFLVAAVIKNESGFRIDAKSKPGAVGLMQIMPATAAWLAQELNVEYNESMLVSPDCYIMLGGYYISYLSKSFEGDKVFAAYNAGEGKNREWGNRIAYKETRDYIKRIKMARAIYAMRIG